MFLSTQCKSNIHRWSKKKHNTKHLHMTKRFIHCLFIDLRKKSSHEISQSGEASGLYPHQARESLQRTFHLSMDLKGQSQVD